MFTVVFSKEFIQIYLVYIVCSEKRKKKKKIDCYRFGKSRLKSQFSRRPRCLNKLYIYTYYRNPSVYEKKNRF